MGKPKILMIGEPHPSLIEQKLIAGGILKVKVNPATGRYVVDSKANLGETKKWLRRIYAEIIKGEVYALRDEEERIGKKIGRLFIEWPADMERKDLFLEFKQAKDLNALKSGMFTISKRELNQELTDAKKLLLELRPPEPILSVVKDELETFHNKAFGNIFQDSHLTVACKAGILDIVPYDSENKELNIRINAILRLSVYFDIAAKAFRLSAQSPDNNVRQNAMRLFNETDRINKLLEEMFWPLNELREKAMCKNISDNYVRGSAIICGLNHVVRLGKLLSERFDVKIRSVGEALYEDIKKA